MNHLTSSPPWSGVMAGVAMTSPFWLDALDAVSQAAATCLPILGALWFVVQIAFKFIDASRSREKQDGPE